MSEFEIIKVKGYKGEYPGYESEWWTEEQWESWSRRKEGYIFSGEYMQEEEVEMSFPKDVLKMFENPSLGEVQSPFQNFGILVPEGISLEPPPFVFIKYEDKNKQP